MYIIVDETLSVVVEKHKLFFNGKQIRDGHINVNRMNTNIETGTVKLKVPSVSSLKKQLHCYISERLTNNKQKKYYNDTKSWSVISMFICVFPAKFVVQ